MRLHNRQIKNSFWTDPDILQWPRDKRWFYMGLIQLADDSGCIEDSPFAFKLQLYPSPVDADITIEIIEQWRDELVEECKLIPYQVESKSCLYIKNFHKHQKLSNCPPPEVPLPPWIIFQYYKSNDRQGKFIVDNDKLNHSLQNSYNSLTVPLGGNDNETKTEKDTQVEQFGKKSKNPINRANTDSLQNSYNSLTNPLEPNLTKPNQNLTKPKKIKEGKSTSAEDESFEDGPSAKALPLSENDFNSLEHKKQLDLIINTYRKKFPLQIKEWGTAGIIKARNTFETAIAKGVYPHDLLVELWYWREAYPDKPDPPPWEIVQELVENCGNNQNHQTWAYCIYTQEMQAVERGFEKIAFG
jgi:hypothetical protein